LREGTGPGSYMSIDKVPASTGQVNMPVKYSVPQNNRGLLTKAADRVPAPVAYSPNKIGVMK